MLVYMVDGMVGQRDLADVMGTSAAVVGSLRQSIRRKLAVPKGADVIGVLHQRGLDDVPALATPDLEGLPVDRRRNLVLRAAIRDLDTVIKRIRAKAQVLPVEDDATAVLALSDRLLAVREQTIAETRVS